MQAEQNDLDSSGTCFLSVDEFEARPGRDDTLLANLRDRLGAEALDRAHPPRPVGEGAESSVLAVALRNAGEWSDRPLVARLLQTDDVGQLSREAAVQAGLADVGFPAPRPVARRLGHLTGVVLEPPRG